MDGSRDIALGDGGWFAALVDEAVVRDRLVPREVGSSLRARHLEERSLEALWASGAVVGSTFEGMSSPVTGRTDPEAAFVELLRFQLAQVVALARTHGPARDAARMRSFAGAALGAFAGEIAAAAVLEESSRLDSRALDPKDEKRLFGIVGARLLRRAYLVGHPPGGLPLHAGLATLDTRMLLRLTLGQLRGRGGLRRRATRHLERLSRAKSLFVELVAGLPDLWPQADEARRTVERQVRAAGLSTPDRRQLLRALDTPRHPARLLRPLPPRVRGLLLEQAVAATLLHKALRPELKQLLSDTAVAVGLPAGLVDGARTRGAALIVEHQRAAAALFTNEADESFQSTLTGASDALRDVVEAFGREIRETGELGVLLARIAQGETLTREERAKVRAQLIDLAKAVPALAIFAAPGGMLLLPAVLKLLPFDLRPSAFAKRRAGEPPEAA